MEGNESIFDDTDVNVIMTGVGKVNAAIAAMEAVHEGATRIINIGTAGSHTAKKGSVHFCTKIGQRDMDATLFGFDEKTTPFGKKFMTPPSIPELMDKALEIQDGINYHVDSECWTGDNTDGSSQTTELHPKFEVVEMEAFAIAAVCERYDIPFCAIKWISDGADEKAGEEWAENADGIPWEYLKQLICE